MVILYHMKKVLYAIMMYSTVQKFGIIKTFE